MGNDSSLEGCAERSWRVQDELFSLGIVSVLLLSSDHLAGRTGVCWHQLCCCWFCTAWWVSSRVVASTEISSRRNKGGKWFGKMIKRCQPAKSLEFTLLWYEYPPKKKKKNPHPCLFILKDSGLFCPWWSRFWFGIELQYPMGKDDSVLPDYVMLTKYCVVLFCSKLNKVPGHLPVLLEIIIIIINPLTVRVVGAPQMTLQPVFSILSSPLPSGTYQTSGLSIPWCCLPTSSSVCLAFFPLSLCLARWFWPDLMSGSHDHTTAVCISLRSSRGLCVVQFIIIMITYIYNVLNDALSASRIHDKLKTILS